MSGGLFGFGLQGLIDGQLRYTRSGLEAFLRIQNFAPEGDFQEVGVAFAPSGTAAFQAGFTDILIDPPPAVTDISTHDIGLSAGKLMFGARKFDISATFVDKMREWYPNIPDSYDVWRNWDSNTPVVGIVYNNRMFSIEDIKHRELGGKTIKWILTCNADENQLASASSEVVQL